MLGISGAEVLFILVIALVVLGPDKLLVTARKAGQVMGELRKVSAGFEAEMRTAMYEHDPSGPATTQPRADPAPPPTADRPELEPGTDDLR
ncbi:MAG: Sec-independent protein translocase subunit TatA/TatB [Acidimicrobiales bacterium]